MTDKSPKLLADTLGAIGSAKDLVEGCTFADYADDKTRRSVEERQLEILGEAGSSLAKLEPTMVGEETNRKLAIDLSNRIIHGYDAVDDEIVFLTVTGDLDALKLELEQLLALRGWAL